jgi:Plasmid pRiA4b ORF-3-like protein
MPESPKPSIYQFRAVLLGISPIIWRRLLVRGDSTIADLHVTLQTAFGWSDDHLHLSFAKTSSGLSFQRFPQAARRS